MKRFLMLFMVFMVFLQCLNPTKSYAVTFTEKDKLTQIIKGVGEKIGVKWTKNSLGATVGYLLGADLAFWVDWASQKDSIPVDLDMSEYKLSPDDFKTATDGIKEAKENVVEGVTLPLFGRCGKGIIVFEGDKKFHAYDGRGNTAIEDNEHPLVLSGTVNSYSTLGDSGTQMIAKINWTYTTSSGTTTRDGYDIVFKYPTGIATADFINNFNGISSCDEAVNTTINSTDIANYSEVNNQWFDNSVIYDSHDEYTIITDNSTTIINNNGDVPPINEVIPDDDPVYNPPPVDTDGDGIDDGKDSTPTEPGDGSEGTNPFASLIPIVFLIKLFGLLGSVLAYFARLFTFIMTIPLIPAKEIDNTAFQWFRDAEIIGIHIYTVVSSLASIGLSFMVARVVRRLF